jgi:hypothetical protein
MIFIKRYLHEYYINDLGTTTCNGTLGHRKAAYLSFFGFSLGGGLLPHPCGTGGHLPPFGWLYPHRRDCLDQILGRGDWLGRHEHLSVEG